MRKKLFFLCVTLLLTTSTYILVSNEFEVKATPGGGGEGEWENETSLDYAYLWTITNELSNVTHNDQLWKDTNWIRKGRAFGTPGDSWTANYTHGILKYYFNLTNVIKDQLKTLDGGCCMPDWKCNYKIETIDFKLHINNENYTMENPVPKNETFVLPSAKKNYVGCPGYKSLDYNRSFTEAKLTNKSAEDILNKKGITTEHYLNVTGYNENRLLLYKWKRNIY